jgi:hypothetical protein
MATIAIVLSLVSGTELEVEILKTIALFCGAGLLASLLATACGLDLSGSHKEPKY